MRPGVLAGLGLIVLLVFITLIVLLPILEGRNVQQLDREQQLVYNVWAYSGDRYNSILYPQAVETLYMVANLDNVLIPKLTEVYYWPIDLEYKADWQALNRSLAGVVVITQRGREVARLEQLPFSLVYRNITPRQTAFGPTAEQEYAGFLEESRQITSEMEAYYEASIGYQLAFEQYLQEIKDGNLTAERPEPPIEGLPQIQRYVSKPEPAYRINLPPGDYELALHTYDGNLVDGSRKQLRVFAPQREAISYRAFIAERWTFPEIGADPNEVFYIQPKTTLYLEPYFAQEFRQQDYARLINPQKPSTRGDRSIWVLNEPVGSGRLKVHTDNQEAEVILYQSYKVRQVGGAALGYTIEPYQDEHENDRPTFSAYRFEAPPDAGVFRLELVDELGNSIPGSNRTVKIIGETKTAGLYTLPLIPLVLGVIVLGWRRITTRRLNSEINQ